MDCYSKVIFMNLENYTINIWYKSGETSEFRGGSEIETDICQGRRIMAARGIH